jgi:isopenicillin N synthase-like dioxygenase
MVEKVKMEIQDFFNLPMSEKKKFWQTPQHVEGFGQAFVVSEDQKLDWADMFYMVTLPKRSRMPHLFPQLPLPLRSILFNFYYRNNLYINTYMINIYIL